MLKTTLTWILTILLALFFIYAGYKKLTGNEVTAQHFREWGYGLWLLHFIGCLELIGALLLLFPATATSGALLLCLIMTGASYTLLSHEVWKTFAITFICLVLLLFAGYLRWNQSWILWVFKLQ
ncbi:DoxX family protein [Mucilaginibacter sp. X4EP1]|uniref:DoxX family protein n=1 Tax=Mucilaginibacter sp. X4EP1 TaxID=2723092 RepID=UPI00216A98ED|nr:DoxX family protein [Mucilaginibacter sp. X4EP1]MCS3811927.1 putative membrane protein YphA (DoxX/SURF4 family) [Mucilaginibacter sp. X4EP1]